MLHIIDMKWVNIEFSFFQTYWWDDFVMIHFTKFRESIMTTRDADRLRLWNIIQLGLHGPDTDIDHLNYITDGHDLPIL